MNIAVRSSRNLVPHLLAIACALWFAWTVFQSAYFQTALQFVGPVIAIVVFHTLWQALFANLQPGFARAIYTKSLQTASGLTAALLLYATLTPVPANADMSEVVGMLAITVVCLAMIAAVAFVVTFVVRLIFGGIRRLISRSSRQNGGDTSLFDWGSIAATFMLLAAMSAEGLDDGYAFPSANSATASRIIDAEPDRVWQTLETATAVSFPLHAALSLFPRPVEVVTDEGVSLAARREVRFHGREGAGRLKLKVTERTPRQAVFTVLRDTTPYTRWIGFRSLSYTVEPDGDGTRLSVRLDYDRLLAPSWFFSPLMKSTAFLAMDVLARDVRARAQH